MTYFVKTNRFINTTQDKKNDLHPVKINTKLYGEKTKSYQGRDYWNKLPNKLKEVTSVALFKRKLKQHILDNY